MIAALLLARIVAGIDGEELNAYGVHVRVGDEFAEHRWRSDDRVNLYSVSKGVCALAVGIAVGEGIIDIDDTVGGAFPDAEFGDGTAHVTLRNLLQMTSGIDFTWFGDNPAPWPDLAYEMLRHPSRDRGEDFHYTDASTYVAMRMLAAHVGDVREWLMPRLFRPLGIHNPQWHRCPLGHIIGGSGLELRTEELSRIGMLLRDRGVWQGRSIVSPAWIDGMHSGWVPTGGEAPFARYGIAAWDGPGSGWRLDGRYGQYVFVDTRRNAVVTITAHEETADQRLVEIVAEELAALVDEHGQRP